MSSSSPFDRASLSRMVNRLSLACRLMTINSIASTGRYSSTQSMRMPKVCHLQEFSRAEVSPIFANEFLYVWQNFSDSQVLNPKLRMMKMITDIARKTHSTLCHRATLIFVIFFVAYFEIISTATLGAQTTAKVTQESR